MDANDSIHYKKIDSDDTSAKKIDDDKTEDSSPLLKSAKQTLENLKRSSLPSALEDGSELDDDEPHLKTPPPEIKTSGRKVSQVVPKMISDDIEKAYHEVKQKSEKRIQERDSFRYDIEQASLMGAVLGIGERDKSKDETIDSEGLHSKIGTLAGLGDITDEDADLRESADSDESGADDDVREQDLPSTSRKNPPNAEKGAKIEKNEPNKPSTTQIDQETVEECTEVGNREAKMSCGLTQRIRSFFQNLFC